MKPFHLPCIYNENAENFEWSAFMATFDDVVIISGCRTPVGKFQGSLSDPDLDPHLMLWDFFRYNFFPPKQVRR